MSFCRVLKNVAEKMYNAGYPVRLIPNKVNPISINMTPEELAKNPMWVVYHEVQKKPEDVPQTFNQVVNYYVYYNCNDELGTLAHYYVDENQLAEMNGGKTNELEG